ncbi:MAG TPA: hypothetical protein VFG42_07500 [Baekduia sp.]|uniref:hypothetical protein n=1 Tax=Baekduia sp. TaxID=2600305 RepID=UPI002D796E84|nr:hypothetical protein [Baekduia sp.]HET6506617.1 hypothetical protein [Baekduia sp.]
MIRQAGTAFAITAVAIVLGATGSAGADTYTVRGCAAGWEAHADTGSAATDTCSTGGGLTAALVGPGPWDGGTFAYHRFTAPAGTRISRVTLGRVTQGMPVGTVRSFSYAVSADGKTLEACAPGPTDTCTGNVTGKFDAVGLDAGSVLFSFGCGADDPNVCRATQGTPSATVTDPRVVLHDTAAPTIASKAVADDGASSGRVRLSYVANDVGGGVYRTLVRVDGKVVSSDPVGGACADVDPTDDDPYEFAAPAPCPASATRAVDFDVLKLPLAEHSVQIDVEDAAGNATPVYGPVVLPKANGSVPGAKNTGSGGAGVDGASTPATGKDAKLSAYFVKNHKTAYTNRYGNRVVIRGQLRTKAKKAVSGARLDVYHLVGGKLRRLGKTGLKTRPDGRLTLILPLNLDTRRIVLAYRAFRPGPITSQITLKLTVRDRHGKLVQQVK